MRVLRSVVLLFGLFLFCNAAFSGDATGSDDPASSSTQSASSPSSTSDMPMVDSRTPGAVTLYRAASGALVFATGSMQWSWGLDDYQAPHLRTSVLNPAVQQITRNVLARFAHADD